MRTICYIEQSRFEYYQLIVQLITVNQLAGTKSPLKQVNAGDYLYVADYNEIKQLFHTLAFN